MSESDVGALVGVIFGLTFALIGIALALIMIISMWKVYSKAGQPGWTAIIPIVNLFFLVKVAGRPGWWFILFFIPFVNFIVMIIIHFDIARNFGKGAIYALGLIFLNFIFWPMLAFGKSEYIGSQA